MIQNIFCILKLSFRQLFLNTGLELLSYLQHVMGQKWDQNRITSEGFWCEMAI